MYAGVFSSSASVESNPGLDGLFVVGYLLLYLGSFVAWVAYFTIMEGTIGATLGKLALGLRVVKVDGSPMNVKAALIRTLLHIVDAFPYFLPFLVGAIFIWRDASKQRLGDIVAGTTVVQRNRLDQTPEPPLPRF